ncbi:MAG: hypothetical protein PF508_06385 [Spirochaeta sp.]|nr:hypothetical protein [Spirochaeta sp.]
MRRTEEKENDFLAGYSRTGASTIGECIADGRRVADAICTKDDGQWRREESIPFMDPEIRLQEISVKKGAIEAKPNPRCDYDPATFGATEKARCLECDFVCNKCVDVCPNRANIAVPVRGNPLFSDPFEIVHIDAYCNECGNCGHFCPWHTGVPYVDKPTVFSLKEDLHNSENPGWFVDEETLLVRFDGTVKTVSWDDARAAARGNGAEARFYALFLELYKQRPGLFGPVEPAVAGVPR